MALVAIYGAILSTYGIYQSYDDKRVKIEVELSYGLMGDDLIETYFIIAKNTGEKTVTLSNVAFALPNEFKLEIGAPLLDGRLPRKIESGESINVEYDMRTLVKGLNEHGYSNLKTISAYFSDQLGNKYMSRPIPIERKFS